jgi:hypothetical protein
MESTGEKLAKTIDCGEPVELVSKLTAFFTADAKGELWENPGTNAMEVSVACRDAAVAPPKLWAST